MDLTFQKSVGEVVATDYRTATIFEKYGIDFCCKGHRSIDEACQTKHIMTEEVMRELKKHFSTDQTECPDYKSWPAGQLIDYIVEKHHKYVEEITPLLKRYLDKLCNVHGPNHPELFDINRLFNESAADLAKHMQKEEMFLFPGIKALGPKTPNPNGTCDISCSRPGMIQMPIRKMMEEHETEGDRFKTIETLSNNYQVPDGGCATYKVAFEMLKEFQNDLHLHIHLENNILFPMALEMEKQMMN